MAIKNRDGTLYNYSHPNPVMEGQNIWNNQEKCVVHNKFGEPVTQKGNLPSRPQPVIITKKVEEIQTVETDPVEEIQMFEAPTNKIEAWCLPAHFQEYVDELYGEKYKRIKYGNKFKFEMLIEDQSDLGIRFWTNTKAVTVGSIVFPKNKDKRWWRVTGVHPEDDIYLLKGEIADYQPSFA